MAAIEEYSLKVIEQILFNWGELDGLEGLLFVVVRCDMELALRSLPPRLVSAVNTVLFSGARALECKAVEDVEWGAALQHLYQVLNVEGLSRWMGDWGR